MQRLRDDDRLLEDFLRMKCAWLPFDIVAEEAPEVTISRVTAKLARS